MRGFVLSSSLFSSAKLICLSDVFSRSSREKKLSQSDICLLEPAVFKMLNKYLLKEKKLFSGRLEISRAIYHGERKGVEFNKKIAVLKRQKGFD